MQLPKHMNKTKSNFKFIVKYKFIDYAWLPTKLL